MISTIIIYVSVVMVMSIICFAAYGLDKQLAVDGSRRVSEGSLHLLALLGCGRGDCGSSVLSESV